MKSIKKRIILGIASFVLVVGIVAAFFVKGDSQKVSAAITNDNGETILNYENKTNILQNIMDNNGKLVILEIVPYKYAGVMDKLCGSKKVRDKIEADKATLYSKFKEDSTYATIGHLTTVKIKGEANASHPFYITYNGLTGEYTVEYPNYFLEEFMDGVSNPTLFEYINNNIEVRSVQACDLKESDLEGVSFVYISSGAESSRNICFNRYIAGASNVDKFKTSNGSDLNTVAYDKKSGGSQYKGSSVNSIGYAAFTKNASGSRVSCDMSWDMVDKLVRFIYKGNEYTGSTNSVANPIPVFIDFKKSVAKGDSNAYKLMALLMKTSNEKEAKSGGVSMYYEDVLADITAPGSKNTLGLKTGIYNYNGYTYATWSWDDTTVPFFNIEAFKNNTVDYINNFVYKASCVDSSNYGMYNVGRGYNGGTSATEKDTSKCAAARKIITDSETTYYMDVPLKYLFGLPKKTNKTIKVLEIQPVNDFAFMYTDGESEKDQENMNNILALARALRIRNYTRIDGSVPQFNSVYKTIEFEHMTVDQFNGMREDLLSQYDIIYIGENYSDMSITVSGGTSLYKNTSLTASTTIYNDTELDGYVYLAYGDLLKVDNSLTGLLPEDYVKVNLPSDWSGYSSSYTTGITQNDNILFSINAKEMWSPLIYNTLLPTDGSTAYYVVREVRDIGLKDYANRYGNARYSSNNLTNRKREELQEYVNSGYPVIYGDNIYHCVDDYYKKKGGLVYPTSNMYYLASATVGMDNTMSQFKMYDSLLKQMDDYELEITKCEVDYVRGASKYDVPLLSYVQDETEYKSDIEAFYGQPFNTVKTAGKEPAYNESLHKGIMKYSSVVVKPEDFVYDVTFTSEPGHLYKVYLINDKNTDGLYKEDPTTDDSNELYYYTEIVAGEGQYSISTQMSIEVPEEYIGMFAWRLQIVECVDKGAGYEPVDRMTKDGYIPVRSDPDTYRTVNVLQLTSGSTNLDMGGTDFNNYMKSVTTRTGYKMKVTVMTTDAYEDKFVGKKYTSDGYYGPNNYLRENNYDMVVIGFLDSFGHQDISDDNGALTCIIDHEAMGKSFLLSHDTIIFVNNANYDILYNGNVSHHGDSGSKGALDMTRKLRYLAGMDKYGVTAITERPNAMTFDTLVPQKADGTYIHEIQGWSAWHLYRNAIKNFSVNASDRDSKTLMMNKYSYGYENIKSTNSTMTTKKAKEINEGQVTLYPFKTADSSGQIDIASTHAQYYDLNLEDEEVVVWYTLDGGSKTWNGDNRYDADTNYYIYSKGNITYSGAGHSSMDKASEHKLFLNTLIKAAVAGNFVPKLQILNASKVSDADKYIIYVDDINSALKVEFKAIDNDLATRTTVEKMINSADYPTPEAYEAAIKERIGRFDQGNVYWVDSSGNKKRLLHYEYGTPNILLNEEKTSFYICNPYVDNRNAGMQYSTEEMNNMRDCYNFYMSNGTVELFFEASDSYGAMGSSTAVVMQQELYDLD